VLAVAVGVAGIWRVVGPNESILLRLDGTTLTYFGVAAALLLLRDVRSFAFGDYKVEFERTRQLAADAKSTAENAQATALSTGAGSAQTLARVGTAAPQPGGAEDDPWKGVFGGSPIAAGRRLDASVEPLGIDGQIFTVRLRVTSTMPDKPLRDAVQFFLHPTFANDRPVVTVGSNGAAELVLRAYGAFTVGVLADEGNTRLELDLAELPHAPRAFRER
jgi:hypothetical protein